MSNKLFAKTLTEAQMQRRAEILRRKREQKRAHIERQMRRAAKHSFDFAVKL